MKTKEQELATEIRRLHRAVNRFAKLMKVRLEEKARCGYTGWDIERGTKLFSAQQIKDAMELKLVRLKGSSRQKQDVVDIANYAMFLERRIP